MIPPLDYYMEKTGKKPDEVSILEREAILLMTEYMRDELKEQIEERKRVREFAGKIFR
jgi:hypothetical protein